MNRPVFVSIVILQFGRPVERDAFFFDCRGTTCRALTSRGQPPLPMFIDIIKNEGNIMKKNTISAFIVLSILINLTACGASNNNTTSANESAKNINTAVPAAPVVNQTEPTPVSKPDANSATAEQGMGSISGTIHFVGAVPNLQKINMSADPKCVANNAGDVFPEALVLGEGQTLANVLVKITKGHEALVSDTPTAPVVIDQKGCRYFPHVIGVQKDQPLKILNPDGTLHNVHIQAQANGEQNEAMPAFRKELEKTFSVVEAPFGIKCDVHPWMKSYVEVFDHPFFTTTKPDGQYRISNLPAGNYEISFWHEKLGQQTANVTVVAGQDVKQELEFKAPEGSAKLAGVMLTNWN